MADFIVHGERVIDGDASTLTELTLYNSGSVTTRTLEDNEFLNITDVVITVEVAGDVALVAGTAAAAGLYIVSTGMAVTSSLVIHFRTPYVCPKGVIPYFSGPGSDKNACIIQGFITPG